MPKTLKKSLERETFLTSQLAAKNRRRRNTMAELAGAETSAGLRRNDLLPRLELEDLPVAELKLPERRLRKSDPTHVREVARAIEALGFLDPVLVGRENLVLDGVIRLEAARLLGLGQIPCIRIDHLSVAQQRLVRLAANRLAEKGQWDLPALKLELGELILTEAPLEITGFTSDEIDHILLDEDETGLEEGPLAPDANVVARAKLGDLYRLGSHRLICGDARDPAVWAKLMEGSAPARLLLTDEPYNVPVAGHVTKGPHREFAMASGEMSETEFQEFNADWMGAALNHLVDGGLLGTFIDWRSLATVESAARSLGLDPLALIVWAKTNAGMGSLYRSQHELLPLYKKGKAPHINNVALGKRGRSRSNLWTYPGASSLGSDARKGLILHPTVKPTALLADALLDLTHRGDIVLDPFLGSGSMLLAAERTGRICHGIEIDPLYVDIIIARFEQATGIKAVKEEVTSRQVR